jgi:Metallo-peptidase family M12B Reprolysin-like/Secretion system C-terminal sorting domain/Proprotein convertase P-domain
MNKVIVLLLFLITCATIHAQNTPIWTPLDQDKTGLTQKISSTPNSKTGLFYLLNENVLREKLVAIPDKKGNINTLEIEFPNSKGILEKFLVQENSNFEPQLQAKYPEIRAYSGIGKNDKNATIYFSMAPDGIQTMVLRTDSESEFIEKQEADKAVYLLFDSKSRKNKTLPLVCKTKSDALPQKISNTTRRMNSNTQVFKTMRLALSCTAEYAQFHGGTKAKALAAMNATMTRINGIYNRDLSVKLNIIANNDLIVYTDTATDPYSEASAGATGAWNQELQNNLTAVITNSGYDIGHLFGATGGGGDAGCIGCVCVDTTPKDTFDKKGSGFTSPADGIPRGDTFDISFVAHEMGHQLGGTHSYSFKAEDRNVNVEPGTGSTIMAYAGLDSFYPQADSDDYFNYASIKQIQDNLATKTCPVSTAIGNSPPTVNAGSDYTIPKGTPFVLTGTGASANGTVSYCWEENDSAEGDQQNANSVAYPTKPNGPLFRSFKPSSSPIRYMPDRNYVLSGNLSPAWESVASVARKLNFNLTVRDNATQGQTNTDNMIVNVIGNSGPFAITSQNKTDFYWDQGANETITWDVANSNTLPGSGNVNIKLSIDGGATFPTMLLANTPNDGVATIVVPTISEKNCRILIEPTGNIYYAVNSMPFAIGYKVTSSCKTYDFATPFAIPESGSFTSKTIDVTSPSSEIITKVTLNATVTHTDLSDVILLLANPQNTTVKLLDRNCNFNSGTLTLQFDDLGKALSCDTTTNETVIAIDPLNIYNKINPQGSWTLRVRDTYSENTGTLDAASITICTQKFESTTPTTDPNKFVVYPNPIPSDKDFIVEFYTNSNNGATVNVYDLLGRKKYERHFDNKGNHSETINLKNVLHGVYFLTVTDENEKLVKKIGIN